MREWSNEYNSFNSYKGLFYRDWYDGIINKKLLPPVEVNIDPCNNCQLFCKWCNSKKIINREHDVQMSEKHLFDLVDFCAKWGVKAICFAGGGEPTLHKSLAEAIKKTNDNGMQSAIITNGLFYDDNQIRSVAKHTRWAGISVDAATKETYERLKGSDSFDNVIENAKKLIAYKPKEVTFKFLIHPGNQHEIFEACKLAFSLGFNAFHTRILSLKYLGHDLYDYNEIREQLSRCRMLENKNFNVYTITHKQDGDGNRRIRFNKCQASPLLCMLEANGDVSVCIDRKGDSRTRLCSHENIEELQKTWGSEKHFKLLENIHPETDCPKCTMTCYQEQIEAHKNDAFCVNFP